VIIAYLGSLVGHSYVILGYLQFTCIGHWHFSISLEIPLNGAYSGYWLYNGIKLGLFTGIRGHQLPNTIAVMGTSYIVWN
jgi:hypothetical protein